MRPRRPLDQRPQEPTTRINEGIRVPQVRLIDENGGQVGIQSTDDALELFKMLRRNTYYLIKTLPESTWSNTVYHPENGTMTLDDWLDIYERHIPEHLDQMQRVYEAWKESK